MAERFDFIEGLKAIQSGQSMSGKDGVLFLSEQATTSASRMMKLLYNDSVLFTIGKTDGDITVFNASADGTVLTEVVDTLAVPVTEVKALTTVPCL